MLILGDNLPDPVTGEQIPQAARVRQWVELAARAEALGFDSVWLGEHHFCDYILSAPPVVLAAIAERTQRVRLGTGVTLLGTLDPVRVAEDYATLDALSDGRVELVVGRGILRDAYSRFGYDPDASREIYAEHLELLLALWTEDRVTWEGRHRAPLEGVRVAPRPVQTPHPPIWVGGGSSTDSVDMAARLGLALMLPSVIAAPQVFAPLVERYRERYAAAGHPPAGARVGAVSHVHVAETTERARARWEPYHMAYLGWVVELIGAAGANAPGGAAPRFPDYETLVAGPSVCGSPEHVTERIIAMRDALDLDVHLAMFDHGGIPEKLLLESVELYAEKVLPLLAG